MAITLDKNVPIPAYHHGPGRPPRYPFGTMAVGDSFALGVHFHTEVAKVRDAATKWKSKHPGWDYTIRKQDDGSYRCWRIA